MNPLRTVRKMFDGYKIPSPGLAATLSPSDGERDGVRGGSADLVADILFAVRFMKLLALVLVVAGAVGLPAQNVSTNPPVSSQLSLAEALELYSDLTERTVLRYPALPNAKLTLNLTTTNRAEIARAIETVAATNGITLVPDGEKFVLVAPESAANRLNPQAAKIPAAGTNDPAARIFPRHSINWTAVRLTQALPIYAEILGQKLDSSSLPPQATYLEIVFVNRTPLTRAELLYALETLFGWNGVKLVPAGDGFVKVVPVAAEPAKPPVK